MHAQVHVLHIVGLHLMIVGAKCQLSVEEEDEDDEDQLFGENLCDAENWLAPVITLYVCSFVRVSHDTANTRMLSFRTMKLSVVYSLLQHLHVIVKSRKVGAYIDGQ